MKVRNKIGSEEKVKKFFYLFSSIIIGIYILSIVMPTWVWTNLLQTVALQDKTLDTLDSLTSLAMFLSIIIVIFGLFFVSKNWLVWLILILLLLPHILLLLVFFGLSSGNIVKTLGAYGYVLISWFLRN